MVVEYTEAVATDLGNGCVRKILVHSGKLMLVEFSFKKGAVGALHRHPHEQTGFILHGSFKFEMEGKKHLLKKGDSYYVPSDAIHGVVALEDAAILDTFTPQREDFLSKG
jgi:quercetin dioxygenase-like cupin family protein